MARQRPGLGRAIAITVATTSAFWVALGAWLFHGHVDTDHGFKARRAAADPIDQENSRNGLMSGLAETSVLQNGTPQSAVSSGNIIIPVAGVRAKMLTDTFSEARASGARRHDAIDIPAAEGTPVLAAAAGRVEKLFHSEEGGNVIYVRSPDGRKIYYYAHLARYAPGLREGQMVRPGQPLGTVGSTGNASPDAPHLHFAVWSADPKLGWQQDASPMNPYPWLRGAPAQVAVSKTSN